jgi:hypothetical protein
VFLIHLLLIPLVIIALFLQLLTPVVMNIPLIAFCFIGLAMAIWAFRRSRREGGFPLFSSLNLLIQTALFLLSLTILIAVTIPSESDGDSPAVVQGFRQFLASQGLIDKPKPMSPKVSIEPPRREEQKPVETVNAPDVSKIKITIDDETPKSATEVTPPKP